MPPLLALDLVRAEAARALQLLRALQVLRDEVNPRRGTIFAGSLLQRVADATEAERRLRSLALTVHRTAPDALKISGDEELLAAAVEALVVAAPALLESRQTPTVRLGASSRPDSHVAFVAAHDGAALPVFWRSVLADDTGRGVIVPGGSGATAALALLRAARQVAELHGGRMSVDCLDGSTTLSITIPLVR
jgi:signal transduction histidine kinase